MKKRNKIINKLFILCIVFIALLNINVYAIEINKGEYSKEYLEWLNLSEEEKENTIPPLPINIRITQSSGNLIDKIRTTLKAEYLPARFDLRDHIEIEVKNQEQTPQCWAFAASSCLETHLALKNKTYQFSERHINQITSKSFRDKENENGLNRGVGSGGFTQTAFTYYSRGNGPILEEDMPFVNNSIQVNSYESPKNNIVQKVDNMVYFTQVYKGWDANRNLIYKDANGVEYSKSEIKEIRNNIKKHIMENGGIVTSIVSPGNNATTANTTSQYAKSNHIVTIIGWDDNFSKEKFSPRPKEDGAYIVLNSWGEQWGEGGFYYISYEDMLVEADLGGVTGISDVKYDNLYQHDVSEVWNVIKTKYAANVFESKDNEKITEVMVGVLSEEKCNIYISESDNLKVTNATLVAKNVSLLPGYNTIKLNKNISLKKGNKFSVIVELLKDDFFGIGIEDNDRYKHWGIAKSELGQSFMSKDGSTWSDIYNATNMMNFSIKVYTQTDEEKIEVSDISGNTNSKAGGKLYFDIKTSYKEQNKDVELKMYSEYGVEYKNLKSKGTKIRGNGTLIEMEYPSNLTKGTYYIDIKLSSFDTITRSFYVRGNSNDEITLQFKDKNFLEYMNKKTNNSYANYDLMQLVALQRDIDNVKLLDDAAEKNIQDITGIQYYKNISSINLAANQVTDIKGLKGLTNLKKLDLSDNPISDFSAISNLVQLEELKLAGCQNLKNIDFLDTLNKLTNLDIKLCGSESLINVEKIFLLENLKTLDMSGWYWLTENDLKDIYKLTNLKYLVLNSCNISSLNFLEKLNIETLKIGNEQYSDENGTLSRVGTNNFVDLTSLSKIQTLVDLDISGIDRIENLNGIDKLENLNNLTLKNGKLKDASIIDQMRLEGKKWSKVVLENNSINDKVKLTNEAEGKIDIPIIIQQALDKGSLLYSENGVVLKNCKWYEFGKSIIVDMLDYNSCCVEIVSGCAKGTTYNIEVDKKGQQTLTISLPEKLTYKVGEELDLAGGFIAYTECNDNGDNTTKINLPNSQVTVSGYDKNKVGEQTIALTYKNKSVKFNIAVVNKESELKLLLPSKLTYKVGEDLDLGGAAVEYTTEEGLTNKIPLFDEEVTVTGHNKNKEGVQTIAVIYKDKTTTFEVTVVTNNKTIRLLLPNKLNYKIGEDLDLTGAGVAYTEDDMVYWVSLTNGNVRVTGYNKNRAAEQVITVTYKGMKETFKVVVSKEGTQECKISIAKEPTKKNYIKGESLSLDGGYIYVEENGKVYSISMKDEGVIVNGFDATKLGKQTITIEYKENTVQYEITVTNALVSISLMNLPQTTYIKGEEFNVTGGKLLLTYEDGSKEEKLMTDDGVTYGSYVKNKLGTQTITVKYKGKTVEYEVVVKNEVVGISISNLPKTTYIRGEELKLTSGMILVTYEDKTTERKSMTLSEVVVTGYDKTKLGEQTLTVSYKEKTAQYKITVKNDIVSIAIKNLPKTSYIKGEEIDLSNGKVLVTYEDKTTEEKLMTLSEVVVTGYDKTKIGNQTLTISYKGKTVKYIVNVIENSPITIEGYEIKEVDKMFYIQNILVNTTVKDLKKKIKTNGTIEVYKDSKKIVDENTKLATGMELRITYNNIQKVYQIVVKGDVSCDGQITFRDIILLNAIRLNDGENTTNRSQLFAGDINSNNSIEFRDIILLNTIRLNSI